MTAEEESRWGEETCGEMDVKNVEMDRGDPDGGDDSAMYDDPSMDEVIDLQRK